MANYWQMPLDELDRDSFQPVKKLMHFGTYYFECPCCGELVGLYRDKKYDPVTFGLYFRRDKCLNGHVADWDAVPESKEECSEVME